MSPARSILRGELETFGLATLLTILEMERRDGMLILERKRQLGRLHVRAGRVVRARIEGRTDNRHDGKQELRRRPTGADAVYELLTWTEGRFELWKAEVEGPDEIGKATSYLLMEGARRIDEARADEGRDDAPAVSAEAI
jgi:hypothetical protein